MPESVKRTWWIVEVDVVPALADAAEERLWVADALAVERAAWPAPVQAATGAEAATPTPTASDPARPAGVRLQGLFGTPEQPQRARQLLEEILSPRERATLRVHPLEDRDWVAAYQQSLQPLHFGGSLWVCPGPTEAPDPDAVVVRLEPSRAFGTGTHASTALCLEWLAAHAPLDAMPLIDYGCGSGILAIAALLLGAPRAWGCDIDPTALQVARDNARHNDVLERLWLGTPEGLPQAPVPLLVANILSSVLAPLAPDFARRQPAGGRLLLSGILEEEAEGLQGHFAPWYHLRSWKQRDGWVVLEGTRIAPEGASQAVAPETP